MITVTGEKGPDIDARQLARRSLRALIAGGFNVGLPPTVFAAKTVSAP